MPGSQREGSPSFHPTSSLLVYSKVVGPLCPWIHSCSSLVVFAHPQALNDARPCNMIFHDTLIGETLFKVLNPSVKSYLLQVFRWHYLEREMEENKSMMQEI